MNAAGDDVLGEAAVHVPTGEQRVFAEVLAPAAAEAAGAVRAVQPGDADAFAEGDLGLRRRVCASGCGRSRWRHGAEGFHDADDLVAGHDGALVRRQVALGHVQVGAADAAGAHADQQLAGAGHGPRQCALPQRLRLGGRGRLDHLGKHRRLLGGRVQQAPAPPIMARCTAAGAHTGGAEGGIFLPIRLARPSQRITVYERIAYIPAAPDQFAR